MYCLEIFTKYGNKLRNITNFFNILSAADSEEALLEQALAMSMDPDAPSAMETPMPDLNTMSEEEQIAYAMQMSLAQSSGWSHCLSLLQ